MSDPYVVLGLPHDASDQAIRSRYLELVRENTPEHAPERFNAIRAAYESLKDVDTRIIRRLFEVDRKSSIETLIEELQCKSPRPRVSLAKLVEMTTAR